MHKNTENLNNVNNKYKIVRYGQWWYGILNTETNIMLRVGPNPDYNGPLDNKENKLLLFKSKDKAQEYIDTNILEEKLIHSTSDKKQLTEGVNIDDPYLKTAIKMLEDNNDDKNIDGIVVSIYAYPKDGKSSQGKRYLVLRLYNHNNLDKIEQEFQNKHPELKISDTSTLKISDLDYYKDKLNIKDTEQSNANLKQLENDFWDLLSSKIQENGLFDFYQEMTREDKDKWVKFYTSTIPDPITSDKRIWSEYISKCIKFLKNMSSKQVGNDGEDTSEVNQYVVIYSMNHYTKVNAKDEEEAKQLLLSKKKNAKILKVMSANDFKRGAQHMQENLIYEELVQSSSDKALQQNIKTEINSGKSPKQAAAIAYSVLRKNESMDLKESKKEKFKFTGKNNGRTIEYEAEGMSLSDAVETFMRIHPDAEDWEVDSLTEAVMDPEYAYKVRKYSNKPIVLYGYRYKHGPQVGLDPEELTEEEFESRKQHIISDYNSASRKAKEGDFIFYVFYKHIPPVEENLKLVKENKSTMKWNMGSDKSVISDAEETLLVELAHKLEDNSPNNYKYKVERTYEDFGAGMQWYTVVCYGKGGSWQVLNTEQWLNLMNSGDVEAAYQSVTSDKYFQDKAGEESWFKLLNKLD